MKQVAPKQGARAGTWVEMADGQQYLVPPIPLRDLQEIIPDLRKVTFNMTSPESAGLPSGADLATMQKFVSVCLKRNYPDLQDLDSLFDIASVTNAFAAGVRVSGLVEAEPGEAKATS